MHNLTLHTVDRKAIPLERRSAFTALAQRLSHEVYSTARRTGEDAVVLSTCERFEVYSANSGSMEIAQVLDHPDLRPGETLVSTGLGALRHLFRVASGLESRMRGESHVLGQVRLALNQARRRNAVRRAMDDAFSYAIRCGRRVHRVTAFGSVDSAYASRAVEWLRRHLNGFEARSVAVVGSGALAAEVTRALRGAGVRHLTIVGRHEGRVAALAQDVGAEWLTLHALGSTPTRFAAMVTAVASSEPVIGVETVQACRTRLLVDLGAAPNVDCRVDGLPGVRVVRLEELGGCEPATTASARAEAVVESELARYDSLGASHVGIWRTAVGLTDS